MIQIDTLLPAAPEGHFWRIMEDDGMLLLQLREGTKDVSTIVYKTVITTASGNQDILPDLIKDAGVFVLKCAFPPTVDWSAVKGDFGLEKA